MRVSIVTINRNDAAGLRATLESTFGAQPGFDDWEQIVVDGASTDGSFAEVDRFRADPHLGWAVSEPDSGIYNAMNKGAAHARGDYLLFLNSGDTLLPGILAKVFAEPWEADIAYGALTFLLPDGPVVRDYPDPADLREWHFLADSLPHPATFLSRRFFESRGGYDERFRIVSDALFFLRAVHDGSARLHRLPFAISRFNCTGLSMNPRFAALHRKEKFEMLAPVFGEKLARRVTRPGPRRLPRGLRPSLLDDLSQDKDFDRAFLRASDALRALWRTRTGRFLLGRFARIVERREARELRRKGPSSP